MEFISQLSLVDKISQCCSLRRHQPLRLQFITFLLLFETSMYSPSSMTSWKCGPISPNNVWLDSCELQTVKCKSSAQPANLLNYSTPCRLFVDSFDSCSIKYVCSFSVETTEGNRLREIKFWFHLAVIYSFRSRYTRVTLHVNWFVRIFKRCPPSISWNIFILQNIDFFMSSK